MIGSRTAVSDAQLRIYPNKAPANGRAKLFESDQVWQADGQQFVEMSVRLSVPSLTVRER
jgi:hypothetical protein